MVRQNSCTGAQRPIKSKRFCIYLCYLVKTFNQKGKFPNQLKQAFVSPIFEKGEPENAISKTSELVKLYEQIPRQQMNEYLVRNILLSQIQFGFRYNYSTKDALLFVF